tara:strand:- start:655 stop:1659 length:1005 start_codon:yes stop_codon:yes gene_type:complete
MKLLLENWREYLKESQYDQLRGQSGFDAPAGLPQSVVDIIAGYITFDIQPTIRDAKYLIEFLREGTNSKTVDWYRGKAYRGLQVSEKWLDEFFKVTAKDIELFDKMTRWADGDPGALPGYSKELQQKARKDATTKPSIVNIFQKLKGEITVHIKGAGGEYLSTDYEGTILYPYTLMESWSRDYSTALSYSSPGMMSHWHQQAGFSYFLISQSKKEEPSKVLSVVLEAEAFGGPVGVESSGGFIDIKKLYKLVPAMTPEKSIKEVPYIYGPASRGSNKARSGGPHITKIHIPYRRFEKAFKKAAKNFSPQQLKAVTPLLKECASEAGIILTEQDK